MSEPSAVVVDSPIITAYVLEADWPHRAIPTSGMVPVAAPAMRRTPARGSRPAVRPVPAILILNG